MNWTKSRLQGLKKRPTSSNISQQMMSLAVVFVPCFLTCVIALLHTNVSIYLTAFISVVLLLLYLFSAVTIRHQSQYQVRTLSNLIESMIDGDYTLRGRSQDDLAFQELLNSVNQLAVKLSTHKMEAQQSRLLLELIMEHMDGMIVATNQQDRVVMANSAAKRLLFEDTQALADVSLRNAPLGDLIIATEPGIIAFDAPPLSGEHLLFKESFLIDGNPHKLYVLTNAERALMEKERSAWQRLLRVLSHEINNSLAPIIAVSQSIEHKLKQAQEATEQTNLLDGITIVSERANALSLFIASYSELYHLPLPQKTNFTLGPTINSLSQLYPDCDIQCHFSPTVSVYADKQQFEQVVINAFKNAMEAMHNSPHKAIEINCENNQEHMVITIRDYGSGIANTENLFVPFYTTKPKGSGIGLTLCRQIMFNHEGTIKLRNHPSQTGCELILTLPAAVV